MINVAFRPCWAGEIVSAGACEVCKPETYSFINGSTECIPCMDNA